MKIKELQHLNKENDFQEFYKKIEICDKVTNKIKSFIK